MPRRKASLWCSYAHCTILMVAVGIKIVHATWTWEEKLNTDILKITVLLSLLKMLRKLNTNIIFYSICGEIVCNPIGSCIILTMHGKPHITWLPAIVKISLKFKKYFFFSKNNLQTRYCDWLAFYSWPQD